MALLRVVVVFTDADDHDISFDDAKLHFNNKRI